MTEVQTDILGRLETCARWLAETSSMVDVALLERRDLILEAKAAGITMVDIAHALHVTRKTVHRVVQFNR